VKRTAGMIQRPSVPITIPSILSATTPMLAKSSSVPKNKAEVSCNTLSHRYYLLFTVEVAYVGKFPR